MAKSAFAGEMRTKVTIQREDAVTRPNGYTEMAWESIFPGPVWCKWVNAHGTEVFDALRLELGEVVTLTMRYSPLVDIRCRVLHAGDAAAVARRTRRRRGKSWPESWPIPSSAWTMWRTRGNTWRSS